MDQPQLSTLLKEKNVELPKALERVRKLGMGDIVLEHLKEALGDDLKISGDGEANEREGSALSRNGKMKRAKRKCNDERKGNVDLAVSSGCKPSSGLSLKKTKSRNKQVSMTATDFAKLKARYTKYKQDNTPRSFGGVQASSTDYKKWEKFAATIGLDEDDKLKNKGVYDDQGSQKSIKQRANSIFSSRFKVQIITVLAPLMLSVLLSVLLGIESMFQKQCIFSVFAIVIFNLLVGNPPTKAQLL